MDRKRERERWTESLVYLYGVLVVEGEPQDRMEVKDVLMQM